MTTAATSSRGRRSHPTFVTHPPGTSHEAVA